MSVISFEEARKRLAKSGSKKRYPYLLTSQSEEHGPTPTDEENAAMMRLFLCVLKAADDPPLVKSRFAREQAQYIGIAASMGIITLRLNEDHFTNHWMITDEGFEWLKGVNHEVID